MQIIEEYTSNDINEMIMMTKEFYGENEISNKQFLNWQYKNNPAGNAVVMLAKDSETNTLAGQYVLIPMRLHVQDRVIKGTLSLNTLTKKEYRGQGIFTKLATVAYKKCSEEGLVFTYGFPNPNSYHGFVNKLNFSTLGTIPLLIRPLNIKTLVRNKVGSTISNIVSPLNFIFALNNKNYDDFIVYEITEKNIGDIDILWDKIKNKYKVIGIRDAEYFKWRYLDIPLRQYKLLGIKKNGDILGYIVGRCSEVQGMRAGMIVDFLVNLDNQKAGEILVEQLLKYFVEKDMDLSGALMMYNTEEYKILKKRGFYQCPKFLEPQPFPVIYRNHIDTEVNQILFKFRHWFLTMGDYDVI